MRATACAASSMMSACNESQKTLNASGGRHACLCTQHKLRLAKDVALRTIKSHALIAQGIPWHEVADHQSLHLRHGMHKMHHTDSNHGAMALSIPKHEQLTCRLQEKRTCSHETCRRL